MKIFWVRSFLCFTDLFVLPLFHDFSASMSVVGSKGKSFCKNLWRNVNMWKEPNKILLTKTIFHILMISVRYIRVQRDYLYITILHVENYALEFSKRLCDEKRFAKFRAFDLDYFAKIKAKKWTFCFLWPFTLCA